MFFYEIQRYYRHPSGIDALHIFRISGLYRPPLVGMDLYCSRYHRHRLSGQRLYRAPMNGSNLPPDHPPRFPQAFPHRPDAGFFME